MREIDRHREETTEQAAAWLARVYAPDAGEADWLALQGWLEADAAHRIAYDRIERLDAELIAAAPEILAALDAAPVVQPFARRARSERSERSARPMLRARPWHAGLAAAAAALIVFVAVQPETPAPAQAYETARGEDRVLDLADGSKIHLNSASRLSVRLESGGRFVDLAEGEAAFDVAHDSTRPFVIDAGDRDIRVVGTQFNVLRHNGGLRVTVREGVVAVSPSADTNLRAQPVTLRVGDELERLPGSTVWTLKHVDPAAAFAWQGGELVYREERLDEVVADLNRYFDTPITLDASAGALKFSGVLRLEDQAAVVRRLEAFLPVDARGAGAGVNLRMRAAG